MGAGAGVNRHLLRVKRCRLEAVSKEKMADKQQVLRAELLQMPGAWKKVVQAQSPNLVG